MLSIVNCKNLDNWNASKRDVFNKKEKSKIKDKEIIDWKIVDKKTIIAYLEKRNLSC